MKASSHAQQRLHPSQIGMSGFSLIEILIVVAVIAVISGLAMTFLGGAAENSRNLVARQQQVQLQTALDAWMTAQSSGTAGLSSVRTNKYSTDPGVMLTNLIPYLRDTNIFSVSGGGVSSSALSGIGKTLQFSSWSNGSYPKVLMQ